MKNTIINAHTAYGFESRPSYLFAGTGSICNGASIRIATAGEMVEITINTYFCNGEVEADTHKVVRCHLSRLWENLPEWVLKR